MDFFNRRRRAGTRTTANPNGWSWFHRKNRDRGVGGYKSASVKANTSRSGRKHAKLRTKGRGRETHVPLMTKIKRTLGIQSTPRRQRQFGRHRY